MTPEEIQILVLAELPDVPATTGRKPITDCTREDLAFPSMTTTRPPRA
jgi:hypothetical protein